MFIASTNESGDLEIREAESITVHQSGSRVSCLVDGQGLTLYHNSTPEKVFSALSMANLAFLVSELRTSNSGSHEFLPSDVIV